MALDVVDLREFYISPLGRHVRALLRERIARIWPDVKGETLLALGYATPLLRPWVGRAGRLLAMMPAAQGVVYWPKEGPNGACLADLAQLPLPDESINRIVCLHALETASEPDEVLREVWRVLGAGGRVLVIVPNRRGFWAHHDSTPFGAGQPYSSGQLRALLRDQGFLVERSWHALYMPPCSGRFWRTLSAAIERVVGFFAPAFGGLLMIEASKQLYAPTLVKSRTSGRRLVLPLSFPAQSGPLAT